MKAKLLMPKNVQLNFAVTEHFTLLKFDSFSLSFLVWKPSRTGKVPRQDQPNICVPFHSEGSSKRLNSGAPKGLWRPARTRSKYRCLFEYAHPPYHITLHFTATYTPLLFPVSSLAQNSVSVDNIFVCKQWCFSGVFRLSPPFRNKQVEMLFAISFSFVFQVYHVTLRDMAEAKWPSK